MQHLSGSSSTVLASEGKFWEHSGYRISRYQRDQLPEVVKLLQPLLGGQPAQNLSYFQWKHHDNPYTSEPLGVTATRDGVVVGFRGYFATPWYLGSKDKRTIILVPGDTVVHPEHRVKGLSVAMGNFAMEQFAKTYGVFLNMSAVKSSVPGYLRMGFAPLCDKAYYSKSNLVRDGKVIYRGALKKRHNVDDVSLSESRVSYGDFGDIVVSTDPKPEEMSRVAACNSEVRARVTLVQDEQFFRWRFQDPKRNYAFYFYRQENALLGYLVMLVSNDIGQGFIVDYGQECEGPIGAILDHIEEKAEFDEVNILNASVDETLWNTLKTRGFKKWGLQRCARKIVNGELPLLVRPVERELSTSDWIVGGLDIRDIKNWNLKEIYGDGA